MTVLMPLLLLATAAGEAGSPTIDLTGKVTDTKGQPVPGLMVFAVASGAAQIRAVTRSDSAGTFSMRLEPHLHDFGIMSARWLVRGFERTEATSVRIVVQPAFPEVEPLEVVRKAKSSIQTYAFPWSPGDRPGVLRPGAIPAGHSIGIISGAVVDETDTPVPGVRILAVDENKNTLVAVAQSNNQGQYTLVTLAGKVRLVVHAAGLLLGRARARGPGRLDLVLSIDARPEEITLRSGHTLSFRIDDSVYPEALPPPQVAARLRSDYGIDFSNCFCPGDLIHSPPPTLEEINDACKWSKVHSCDKPSKCPATVWARQCQLPKYWWLRLLQLAPPNQAQIVQTTGNLPPSAPTSAPADKVGLTTDDSAPTMWWYEAIRAMQEADARVSRPKP